jgi:hypothetical protein
MKKSTVSNLALAAAFAGLISGTSVRLNAQTTQSNGSTVQSTHAGILLVQDKADKPLPKHACAGKNDCKGEVGGAHPGQNECKGQGGCATDGSHHPDKAPNAA